MKELEKNKYAYKCLEKRVENKRYYIPSRINRGLLEIAGRMLRSLKDRRELYSLLKETGKEPQDWDYELLKKDSLYRKSQYIENLKEQALNYLKENDSLPEDYLDLVDFPKLKNGMITYSPDDGQAIKLETNGKEIKVCLKVLKEDIDRSESRSDWEWIKLTCALPDIVAEKDQQLLQPSLRLSNISGRLTPVLDLKISVEENEKKESKNFLTVDWGLNKLVTVCVFSESGEQISRPFFLKSNAIQNKLFLLRKEIDNLKSKRDKLPYGATKANWYNREIAKKWNKFSSIQKQLSHMAANVIVEIARIYNCSRIYVEWLKSLKSRKFGRRLNWKINSQVRQKIYEKVEYKANLAGISLERPINPGWTSQFCPKCGKRGLNVKASDRLDERTKSGGWFYCKNCGYNADRDYVACQNLARLALYGNKLKNMSKAFAYKTKAISGFAQVSFANSPKLFRQSIDALSRLR
ncbi:MAG: zinc ribbon domain-containing protein, partial [Candidatus Hydrothermarchaeota archaeon]